MLKYVRNIRLALNTKYILFFAYVCNVHSISYTVNLFKYTYILLYIQYISAYVLKKSIGYVAVVKQKIRRKRNIPNTCHSK